MKHPIFDIDTDICTERVVECFDETMEQIKKYYCEFITPEHLLYTISFQNEFLIFCNLIGTDASKIHQELSSFLTQIDSEPDEEEMPVMPSLQLQEMARRINMDWKGINGALSPGEICPITMADLVTSMYELEESYARYVLERYFGDDVKAVADGLESAYAIDIENFHKTQKKAQNMPIIAEAFINGKKVEINNLTPEELYGKLMASAGRLMGAIHSIGNGMGHGKQKSEENEQPKREPWEELVTSISETYKTKNPLIGRERELQRTIRALCRKDKNNPLFVGEAGVGKTAMIYGLARLIDEGNVPSWLQGQRIYALDMASMVAGASFHGEFEKRMKAVLEGAKERGNCIIYIDEIHTIMGNGSGNNTASASDMLKPYLEDGAIRFIGSTTYQEFNKHMAKNKAIVRRFQQIDIKEPTIEETIAIMQGLLPGYEKHHGVRYAEDAVRYAIEQSASHIHDRFLPDKAIDIIDEAGAYLQQNPLLDKNGNPKQARYQKVGTSIIKQILTDVCRIDAKALTSESNADLKNLAKRISDDIYGQDEAVRQVVRSVMMSKAGLTEPEKPIASLLFVGPTGVGKTEVCKVLARELGVELVRFDMSEYTEKHTISKLIGSPAGYVGYEEGGLLTDAIRKTPNCVLLLDEIEKAHTDIYNILLQVMDYARLTDSKGNKIDFRNVILVMTSNAGAQFAGQASIGFGGGQTKGQAMLASVKKTFKPEFLNRLSGTAVFNDMDEKMALLILNKKLNQLSERLESKNVKIEIDKSTEQFLLKKGYNPQYGAREMDRALQQHLTPLLMEEILFGRLKKGGKAIITLSNDGQLLINC